MSESVYKIVKLVRSSSRGSDQAISSAMARASKAIRRTDRFEVKEFRGHVAGAKVAHSQAVMRVGFRLED